MTMVFKLLTLVAVWVLITGAGYCLGAFSLFQLGYTLDTLPGSRWAAEWWPVVAACPAGALCYDMFFE